MKFTHFFVDRPIFAAVLSVILVIVGAIALVDLPLSEYPSVSPPTVVVRAGYPGANPKVIAETVAGPLEQEINGVEGMEYMSSQAASDGWMTLTITFTQGVDPDLAQVQVQNRVARALPRLPAETQRLGVTTEKTSPDMLMVVHLVSPGEKRDPLFLSNYALLQVRDELSRTAGVGSVRIFGAGEYSMRVWLDPQKLAARSLTASDVVRAIREQNVQVAAGSLGQPPGDGSSAFQVSVLTQGRLSDEEQFRDIVIKTGANGQVTRLKDVARVELGANTYAFRGMLDGKPAVALQIAQTPGANALDVAASVRARMAELKQKFPEGVDYRIAYDPTIFVRSSIDKVITTLLEAVFLVVLVVILFLQSWRASIIPLVAVPISLIGTAAVMHLLGFSLNTLSLFGLVLSIGIVVDDAIVVVENVERHLAAGLRPKDAARRAMTEVTGPIIAITSVLAAVFIPTAFLGGLTGQFYRQFALTIAISTILSAFTSLTLSPALAGVLLRGHGEHQDKLGRLIERLFGRWVFRPFNRFFDASSAGYVRLVKRTLRVSVIALVVYGGLLAFTWLGYEKVPKGFVPMQDKYYLVGIVQLPPAASLDRTEDVLKRVSEIALAEPGVESVVAFPGLSINGFVNASNEGVMFAMLDPFEQRTTEDLSAGAIAGKLWGKFGTIQEGFIGIFPPPPVPGLGALGGFKMQVEDRAGHGHEALFAATQQLVQRASADPALAGLLSSFQVNVPQVSLDVDRVKAKTQGVALGDLFDTLQIHLGSLYVNDFNRFGRTWQVNVQADAQYRTQASDIAGLKVRNAEGEMVPLGSLVDVADGFGPDRVMRYNGYPSADVSGGPAPGASSGEAVAAMERLASQVLPAGMTFEWTDLTHQEKRAGNAGVWIFPLAILLAYLILAAQYNSWTLPLAVILIVPLSVLSALAGVFLTGGDNNIFTQIGLVVLVGLAAKNAILIVEFARSKEDEGLDPVAAALEACRLRLRPILMTSIAFIMGVVPLAIGTGAGAEMRQAMGIAVLAGMLGVTLFGLLLTPIFYVVIRKLETRGLVRKLATGIAALVLVLPFGASAEGDKRLEISLDQALDLALRNNLELEGERLLPGLAASEVGRAKATFDPTLSSRLEYTRDRLPAQLMIRPDDIEALTFEAVVRQQLPWGTSYELGYGYDRVDLAAEQAPGATHGARLHLGLRQPLLKGAWGIEGRTAVAQAERTVGIADAELARRRDAILARTVEAYWRLVRARESMVVASESLRVAKELHGQTQIQVTAGTLEPVEVTQASAGVALREEAVIRAEAEIGDAQDALLRLVAADEEATFDFVVVPTERIEAEVQAVELQPLLQQAHANRPELAALRLAVDNEEDGLKLARNQLLPSLDAVGSVGVGGLDERWADGHRELGSDFDSQYRWSAGLQFTLPIGNRAARSGKEAAELSFRRTKAALRDVELRVSEEVRSAARAVNASAKRVLATREAVRLAGEQLRAEKRLLEVGHSTSFRLLRLEADLVSARNAQIAAVTDHLTQRFHLDRVVGGLGEKVATPEGTSL